MSPAAFAELVEGWKRREARADRRAALVAYTIAAVNRTEDSEPFDLRDFMPMTEAEAKSLEAERRAQGQRAFSAAMSARHAAACAAGERVDDSPREGGVP